MSAVPVEPGGGLAGLRTRWLLWLAMGCGCATLDQARVVEVWSVVRDAEQAGAYHCAPRELALAKAHLTFADAELRQGNGSRAVEHLRVAEPNARAARSLSGAGSCGLSGVRAMAGPVADLDGDGILDAQDDCPLRPEDFDNVVDDDGCPEDQDTDRDSVPDARDACLLEAEDADGYLDGDGCPEPDNDLDGVPDHEDRCPSLAEDPEGFADTDGCPDPDNDSDDVPDVSDRCPLTPGHPGAGGCPRGPSGARPRSGT